MKWIQVNGQTLPESEWKIAPNDRAFRYGDGLFESIMAHQGRLPLWPAHAQRLAKGMELIYLSKFSNENAYTIQNQIVRLLDRNQLLKETARVRLQIWRKEGGLYTPETNDWHYLIEVEQHQFQFQAKEQVDFSQTVSLQASPWSEVKTLQRLPQVMAAREKQLRGLDDLILLSQDGFISETTHANIFWKQGNDYFTPSLETGCLAGITRAALLDYYRVNHIKISEIKAKPEVLLKADSVFTTNVSGLHPIANINQKSYAMDVSLEQMLLHEWYGL
jgi:4-amino-4-deoxychorismate lyase